MSCITEILKLKGDQDVLIPDGNWIAVEGGGLYNEYEYLIVLNSMGHRCGYVALPPTHKYSQTPEEDRMIGTIEGSSYKHYDYDDLNIECHGGLTFMSLEHGLKDLLPIRCDDIWIGFDCGHYLDLVDEEAFKKYFCLEAYNCKESFFDILKHNNGGATVKDFDYVEKECHLIIDQLIQVNS